MEREMEGEGVVDEKEDAVLATSHTSGISLPSPSSPPTPHPPPESDEASAPPPPSVPATPSQSATPSHSSLRPVRSHAPPTTIQYLLHPGVGVADGASDHTPSASHEVVSTKLFDPTHYLYKPPAHAPQTTIQHLLYPLTSTTEATPTTLQLLTPVASTDTSICCPPPQPYPLAFPRLGMVVT